MSLNIAPSSTAGRVSDQLIIRQKLNISDCLDQWTLHHVLVNSLAPQNLMGLSSTTTSTSDALTSPWSNTLISGRMGTGVTPALDISTMAAEEIRPFKEHLTPKRSIFPLLTIGHVGQRTIGGLPVNEEITVEAESFAKEAGLFAAVIMTKNLLKRIFRSEEAIRITLSKDPEGTDYKAINITLMTAAPVDTVLQLDEQLQEQIFHNIPASARVFLNCSYHFV